MQDSGLRMQPERLEHKHFVVQAFSLHLQPERLHHKRVFAHAY
jgi:hypothetical protein